MSCNLKRKIQVGSTVTNSIPNATIIQNEIVPSIVTQNVVFPFKFKKIPFVIVTVNNTNDPVADIDVSVVAHHITTTGFKFDAVNRDVTQNAIFTVDWQAIIYPY